MMHSRYSFNAEAVANKLIWSIRYYFNEGGGKGCNAIFGLSGGKDSTVLGMALVKALGPKRVWGVLMPNGVQSDLDEAKEIGEYLGINLLTGNINGVFRAFGDLVNDMLPNSEGIALTTQASTNLPPRIRLVLLRLLAQQIGGNFRVINTSNLSERTVGYSTLDGDGRGDFSPGGNLTVTEIIAIGKFWDIPEKWVDKTPSSGLHQSTDEEELGFSYKLLDKFIRGQLQGNVRTLPQEEYEAFVKIRDRFNTFRFKLNPMPIFDPGFPNSFFPYCELPF